jgi:CubicO group peptidase (beta-lactamase class C family)
MLTASGWKNIAESATFLLISAFAVTLVSVAAQAQSPSTPDMKERIDGLVPELERYLQDGMANWHIPGAAIGIVTGDRLHYARGFGKHNDKGEPVDTKTVFQGGSITKAFLAATIAIEVDKGRLRWDDRVVDLYPPFQLKDPWVTQEFRVFDLLAQRSSLPPYANDVVAILGVPEELAIRSLRDVESVSSFRTTYAYTNLTHLLAGRIIANKAGQPDWSQVLKQNLLEPLEMNDSSYTADAIRNVPNHADGYHWTPGGSTIIPFSEYMPYVFGGAGNINSSVEDLARWIRLQLGNGSFAGKQIVSADNLAVTRIARVPIDTKASYANGWIIAPTENGTIVWHHGSTLGFGTFVGLLPDRDVGIVVLTNVEDKLFPASLGLWTLYRILGSPLLEDPLVKQLELAKAKYQAADKLYARPANPQPGPDPSSMTGKYSDASFGAATMTVHERSPALELATGAKLQLSEWDSGVFTISVSPVGRFKDLAAAMGPRPVGFAQWQVDKEGKYSLRLQFEDGPPYRFRRLD